MDKHIKKPELLILAENFEKINKKEKLMKVINSVFKIDKELLVILKGHLEIEKSLDLIIENFIYHPQFIKDLRLTFYQKVKLSRSISINKENSNAWLIIEKINSLRNTVAHEKKTEKRKGIIKDIKNIDEDKKNKKGSDYIYLMGIISYSLGFLSACKKEAKKINIFKKELK